MPHHHELHQGLSQALEPRPSHRAYQEAFGGGALEGEREGRREEEGGREDSFLAEPLPISRSVWRRRTRGEGRKDGAIKGKKDLALGKGEGGREGGRGRKGRRSIIYEKGEDGKGTRRRGK
jgi:hypothetical protein